MTPHDPLGPSPIAIVTPSFRRDFELCKTLNRSVLEFLPKNIKHYIFVDARDLTLFRQLESDRTIVAAKEEVMPRGIVQIGGLNRWRSTGSIVPISGWLVQQIAKIATAAILRENVIVMVDSDAVFVRDVDVDLFTKDGKTRLYRAPGGITATMTDHVKWYRNACRLLDVVPETPPVADYIGQIISWDPKIVAAMCDRIERVTGRTWYDAIAHARHISEYLLYGAFVERVTARDGVWIDELTRCNTRWELWPLLDSASVEFAESMDESHVALMISSESHTTSAVRQAVIEVATNGRLR